MIGFECSLRCLDPDYAPGPEPTRKILAPLKGITVSEN
jgi:hypothetical protein